MHTSLVTQSSWEEIGTRFLWSLCQIQDTEVRDQNRSRDERRLSGEAPDTIRKQCSSGSCGYTVESSSPVVQGGWNSLRKAHRNGASHTPGVLGTHRGVTLQ